MIPGPGPFLTGEWRYLAIMNFAIDPAILLPLVPSGTELDPWNDQMLVSVVGFLFRDTRVRGIPFPGHRTFEEVNTRFYVRRRALSEWRKGVTFVREIVPRRAVAHVARSLYNEPYQALPMNHRIESPPETAATRLSVVYTWKYKGTEQRLTMSTASDALPVQDGSIEHFITERHWGYTMQRDGSTLEYRVNHARWLTRRAHEQELECDIAGNFGKDFVACLSGRPSSAFLAEGSPIEVFRGVLIERRT